MLRLFTYPLDNAMGSDSELLEINYLKEHHQFGAIIEKF